MQKSIKIHLNIGFIIYHLTSKSKSNNVWFITLKINIYLQDYLLLAYKRLS